MTTQTIRVKNGTITLPKKLQKTWKGVEVFIFPADDTLIVKKVQKSLETEWNEYEAKLRKGRKKISPKIISQAVKWAKARA